jgi:hypothetical protein
VLGLDAAGSSQGVLADPGRAIVWAVAEPDLGQAALGLLGAGALFLGTDAGRVRRGLSLVQRAVAAADRLLRQRPGSPDGLRVD